MNLENIFSAIQEVDPEFADRISPRRKAIRNMASMGSKVALSALPLALGSLFQKAYGQTQQPTSVGDILKFALTLENLEADYYTMAVATPNLIPAADLPGITRIRDDEKAHVAFLTATLNSINVAIDPKPQFDFTAGGAFAPFSAYGTFLAVAQAFEDTGVRAYKGQAAYAKANRDVLGAALNIHSVEARHASHIRMIRRKMGAATKPWITGNDLGGLPSATSPVYAGEENDTQAGAKITGITYNGITISANAATEAFDEPLSYSAVLAIAGLFIKP